MPPARRRAWAPIALAVLLALTAAARAEVLQVPSDAYPTIQSAVDDAVAGDVVRVRRGLYTENVLVTTSGIEIKGEGTINGAYAGPCLEIQADGVLVTGLQLVNGTVGLAVTGSLPIVRRTRIAACAGAGMDMTGGPFLLGFNTVTGCGGQGIRLAVGNLSLQPNVLFKNRVSGCQAEGILAQSTVATAFTIEANQCERNGLDGIAVNAPTVVAAIALEKNRSRCNAGHGIFVDSLGVTTAARNRCTDNGGDGLCGGQLVQTERNVCSGNVGSGLHLTVADDRTHERNRCQGNGLQGLHVDATGASSATTVLRGVATRNGRDGFRFEGPNGGQVTISDSRGLRNAGDGIDVGPGLIAVVIEDNTLRKNRHEGIDNSGASAVINRNVSRGNIGLDIAGSGKGGVGSVDEFFGNSNATGGPDEPQSLEL